MNAHEPFFIGTYAVTFEDLKKLPLETQAILLLKRLRKIYCDHKVQPQQFNKGNMLNRAAQMPDPEALAVGFPDDEKWAVVEHLLRQPWLYLEQNYYVTSVAGNGWYELTQQGLDRANDDVGIRVPDRTILTALKFLHPYLQDYGHYFYEGKHKEAVSAAFKRVENRFNEIRDASGNTSAKSFSGVVLPRKLIEFGIIKFPFDQLANGNQSNRDAYTGELKNLLSSAIGWFRNSFEHEPHNLPELSEGEALEYLFVASYILRTIDRMA